MLKNLIIVAFLIFSSFSSEAQNKIDSIRKYYPEKELKKVPYSRQELPLVVDHSSEMPRIPLNQGSQGSCMSFAVSYLKTWEEAQENGWDINLPEHQFSPAFIFNSSWESGNGYRRNPISFVCQRGSVSLKDFPYNEFDQTTKPSLELQYKALYYRDQDWGYVYDQDSTKSLEKVKKILINQPVVTGIYFTGYGHEVCVVGYNDTILINGRRGALKFINSYGPNWKGNNITTWGENGYGWIPYNKADPYFEFLINKINEYPKIAIRANISDLNYWGRNANLYFCNRADTLKSISIMPAIDTEDNFWITNDSLETSDIDKLLLSHDDWEFTASINPTKEANRLDSILSSSLNSAYLYDKNNKCLIPLDIDSKNIRSEKYVIYQYGSYYSLSSRFDGGIFMPVVSDLSSMKVNDHEYSSKLNAYPNPFIGSTMFNINCEGKQLICLKIYDITGKIIDEILDEANGSENLTIRYSKNLKPGIYIASANIDSRIEKIKIIAK